MCINARTMHLTRNSNNLMNDERDERGDEDFKPLTFISFNHLFE